MLQINSSRTPIILYKGKYDNFATVAKRKFHYWTCKRKCQIAIRALGASNWNNEIFCWKINFQILMLYKHVTTVKVAKCNRSHYWRDIKTKWRKIIHVDESSVPMNLLLMSRQWVQVQYLYYWVIWDLVNLITLTE